jgi:hypothetical protein
MSKYDGLAEALNILSKAKLDSMDEVIDRAHYNAHRSLAQPHRSVYDAMEAWRTVANAWDYVLDSK